MRIAERSGVEIDYWPKCRGVWLDRGELDKIIERAGISAESYDYMRRRMPEYRGHPHKKPKTFVREFFDLD